MDILSVAILLVACIIGVGADIAFPYITKLNAWKKKWEEAEAKGEPEPDFDVFWKYGRKFNKVFIYIGALDFLVSAVLVFCMLMVTQQTTITTFLEFWGTLLTANKLNGKMKDFLAGKITSIQELKA